MTTIPSYPPLLAEFPFSSLPLAVASLLLLLLGIWAIRRKPRPAASRKRPPAGPPAVMENLDHKTLL